MIKRSSGKEDLARCAHISSPMRSGFQGFVHVRRLTEDNKEDEELMDVAPN